MGSGEVPLDEEEWQDIDVCESLGDFEDITPPSPVKSSMIARSNVSSEQISNEDFQSREEIIFLNPRCALDHNKIEGSIRDQSQHPPCMLDHQVILARFLNLSLK